MSPFPVALEFAQTHVFGLSLYFEPPVNELSEFVLNKSRTSLVKLLLTGVPLLFKTKPPAPAGP